MHRVDQDSEVFRLDPRMDAVSEVEYVPWIVAEAGDHLLDMFTNGFGRRIQSAGIEIPL